MQAFPVWFIPLLTIEPSRQQLRVAIVSVEPQADEEAVCLCAPQAQGAPGRQQAGPVLGRYVV